MEEVPLFFLMKQSLLLIMHISCGKAFRQGIGRAGEGYWVRVSMETVYDIVTKVLSCQQKNRVS